MLEKVVFNAVLQRGNRLQVPRLVRWRYKLETYQILKVSMHARGLFGANSESFLVRMSRDGRIRVPKLIVAILKCDKPLLVHYVFQVTLEPS